MTQCDCIQRIDDAMIERGNPTRVSAVLFLSGQEPRAAVEAYVPDHLQPRTALGRLVRRVKPVRLIATYCPWCGEKYPEPQP